MMDRSIQPYCEVTNVSMYHVFSHQFGIGGISLQVLIN